MNTEINKTHLYKWLESKSTSLAARVLHIRDELKKWMPQVTQFFPQYPSHGVDHSDRIVEQLSRLLFKRNTPVVKFSTAEVYCLTCASYLHDMGMVVSQEDATAILKSEDWKTFVGDGGKGHEFFQKYATLRDSVPNGTPELILFQASQLLRYLIADFVRRDHHERGKVSLELHPFLRQLVGDGDSVAFETISDIGVGHGLRDSDLLDKKRFPEERDVFDGKVNVRFLSRLLRIGDLLDMSSKRADPMTARSIGPLPTDAKPHWQQYSAKKHENITPKVIEFSFECMDQDTHRVLRDWFAWLESEIRSTGLEQLHSARHSDWKAPRCVVDSQTPNSNPTIIIEPAAGSKYTFHDWKFELDHELVLQRLIKDVYHNPTVFIRELIQNALDATRCQMYLDFTSQHPGETPPDRPTQFSESFRERYPILLSIADENVPLSSDGPTERRSVVIIEDHGTGMNEEIIRRYFLQVGRSYYQSNEFRERYKFAPTSRFGIGFLSVFAISKDIVVETARRNEETGKVVGIRLNLREPRNYVLTEDWIPFVDRGIGAKTGTRIRVVLDHWSKGESIAELVRKWCVAVEVPVRVIESGSETVIRRERLKDKTVLAVGRADPEARFVLRTFELDSRSVEGQLAIIAYVDRRGEGWCDCWSDEKDLNGKRLDTLPTVNIGFKAFHGIKLELFSQESRSQWQYCYDIRSADTSVSLNRGEPVFVDLYYYPHDGSMRGIVWNIESGVALTAQKAIERHFIESNRPKELGGIYYVGEVLSRAPVNGSWRDQYPEIVVTWQQGKQVTISVSELLTLNEIIFPGWVDPSREYLVRKAPPMKRHPRDCSMPVPIVSWSDIPDFACDRLLEKINHMSLAGVRFFDEDLWLVHFSETPINSECCRAYDRSSSWVTPLPVTDYASISVQFLNHHGGVVQLLNQKHKLIRWLAQLRANIQSKPDAVKAEYVETAWRTASRKPYEMSELLDSWDKSSEIPAELKPPKTSSLTRFDYLPLVSHRTLMHPASSTIHLPPSTMHAQTCTVIGAISA